jgi:uroporphyrinogen-III synthase
VLIVRGGDEAGRPTGRDWLANEIDAAGGRRDTVVAYRRLAAVVGRSHNCSWPKTAPKAARSGSSAARKPSATCGARCPAPAGMRPAPWSTHARIGEAARAAGFGALRVCTPLRDALVASIESLA